MYQKLTRLANLFLADNQLEAVPHLPESLRTVHLQVCLYIQYPSTYLIRTVTHTLTSTSFEQWHLPFNLPH